MRQHAAPVHGVRAHRSGVESAAAVIFGAALPLFMKHHLTHLMMTTRSAALLLALPSVSFASAAQSPDGTSVEVYTTAMDTDLRLALEETLQLLPARQSPESDTAIFVAPERSFQTLLGLGGAITDASAEVYAELDPATQQSFMRSLFSEEEGLGYSLIRTPIHSCDFSSASYTYIEDGDEELSTFDVAPDRRFRIPMIREAIRVAGGSLTTCASPWSAPAFMKDNGNMLQGGKLLPRYRAAWANYFTRFIAAYEAEGIPIWGVTVQNEPLARQTWESMIYTAEEERDFLRDHLGPTMEAAGYGDRKIVVWDHNRDLVTHRAHTILSDPEAAKYAWGVGFHWYETWAGGEPMFGNVEEVGEAYPGVNVLLTEATVEGFDPARYQHWPNAERYGHAILNDLNAGAVGWIDWNVLLDDTGGPNHVGNFCFAPVHAERETGELIYTPTYSYIGHFSKFMRPGAERVSAVSTRSTLQTTSFMNPDGRLATVVLNLSDAPVTYRFCVDRHEAPTTIPARAIQTLVYDTEQPSGWQTDFFDDFDTFSEANWQDQMIWVNNEKQCYVPDNQYGTREVSNGSIKLKVINIGEPCPCDNLSKKGEKHPDTQYVAGRICSKNRQEFVKGRWTARLRTWGNGEASMFPAWWILGAQNNEAPVQEGDETVPWPLTGSGEIDIFEHHGDGPADHFTTGAIKNLGNDKGDWWTLRTDIVASLDEYHEYSVEWAGADLIYRVDGQEVHRNPGEGDKYPEAMFAILNYAKITDTPMSGEWVMEVDWVRHESWDPSIPFPDPKAPVELALEVGDDGVELTWSPGSSAQATYNVYRAELAGERGVRVARGLAATTFRDDAPPADRAHFYTVTSVSGSLESGRSDVARTPAPAVALPARLEAEFFSQMKGAETEACGDEGGGLNLGFFDPGDTVDFKVKVERAGDFKLTYRLASQSGSDGFTVLVDGTQVDAIKVPDTGEWQLYTTVEGALLSLEPGEHTIRLLAVGNQWNLNWLELGD